MTNAPSDRPRIVGVAIKYPNGLVCWMREPCRHFHIIRAVAQIGADDATPPGSVQGFVTNDGRFVTREEAGAIADATGQAKRTPGSYAGGPLFSEDLW